MSDLIIRPLQPGEHALFESMPDQPVGLGAFGRTYRDLADRGEYRPQWSWVALRDGTVVARAAWWAPPGDDTPRSFTWLDFTDADAALALLRTAGLRADYLLAAPPGWRDRPELASAVRARLEVVTSAGWTPLVERFHYTWTPEYGLPERPTRLVYRPEPDDGAVLDVLRRIHVGTRDAHAQRAVAARGIEAAAREDLDLLLGFPGPRDWWRLAYTPAGELVGLLVPSRNSSAPIVALVGVVPEQRGHGYGYDLLVECTYRLVEEGADLIVADTDVTNPAMAAAFARARYPVTQERIFLNCPA